MASQFKKELGKMNGDLKNLQKVNDKKRRPSGDSKENGEVGLICIN